MFCINCGSKLVESAKFCANCGSEKTSAPEQPTPKPASTPTAPPTPPTPPTPPPSVAGKKTPKWIPITIGGAALALIIGVILILGALESDSGDGGDAVITGDSNIDGQQLVAEQERRPGAALPQTGHDEGEVVKGEITPVALPTDIDADIQEVAVDIEWLEFSVASVEEFGVDNNTCPIFYEEFGRAITDTIVHFEIINSHMEYALELTCDGIFVNGEAIDTKPSCLCLLISANTVSEGRIILDSWFTFHNREIDGLHTIDPGDVLTFSAFVALVSSDEQGNWITEEELGRTEFIHIVSEIDEPGSNAYDGWITTHEDITLMITNILVTLAADRTSIQSNIEFVMLNPTDYEIIFGEISVYHNDELHYYDDDLNRPFFIIPPNSAARNEFRMFDIHVDHSDVITIRGRLRVIHDAANVAVEIIEFSIVL